MKKRMQPFALCAALFLLAACAANDAFHDGQLMMTAGDVEGGLAKMEEAYKASPNDVEIRDHFLRNRAVVVQRYLAQGETARAAGAYDQADVFFKQALRWDADNARAKAGLEGISKDKAAQSTLDEAQQALKSGDRRTAREKADQVLAANPSNKAARSIVRKLEERDPRAEVMSPALDAELKKPVTIELRDAPVRSVLEIISKRSGLNFVYDKDIPADARATVFVRDTPIEEVLRFVLVTNQLEQRVLNQNTVLIYPNTPQKNQAFKELVVRSFFLANADAKQTANMVRNVVKTRDLFVDEKTNMLVVRDTPEAVAMVEKMLASHDLPEPEVTLEVEVMEVGYNTLTNLGIQWPGSASLSVIGAAGVPGQLTGNEVKNFNSNNARLTVSDPLLALNLREQAGRAAVLANPRIRVKNREKAHIHIGDKVPVITTTAGATGFVSESVNYLDVGLKLDVEPQVYLEDDVGIKIALEVSSVSQQNTTAAGTTTYQLSTRNASTALRLKDGETQVLAGLISDEDRRAASQVPGMANLPLLGRLFRNNNDTVNKTEIVLLITPHIVRNIERPSARLEQFNSGTEFVGTGSGDSSVGAPQVIMPREQAPALPNPQNLPPNAPPPAGGSGYPPPAAGPARQQQQPQ
jgi:general secretion pathway protein D